ncbi:MAG: hypothetical protein K9L31_02165 [Candidatus Pacebacteria bacterium]|nr:hypothetical protein [Candidatus Paceibacterota bacterium]
MKKDYLFNQDGSRRKKFTDCLGEWNKKGFNDGLTISVEANIAVHFSKEVKIVRKRFGEHSQSIYDVKKPGANTKGGAI